MFFSKKQKVASFTSHLRSTTCCVVVIALLSVGQIAYAKDNQGNGKQASPRAKIGLTVQGDVRGLERARQRTDGAFVVPGHVNGKGKINAEHVVFEGRLSPGNSPGCINFSGDVTFSSTATLVIELGGLSPCTEYDQINVDNTLTINNASLELVLIIAFMPQFGDSFDVLSWSTLSGSGFSIVDVSAAVLSYPLEWDLSQLYVTGKVSVGVSSIADGDLAPFDAPDGVINAADVLIALQLTLDQRAAGALQYAHGDMNGDNVIDILDLRLIENMVMQN